MDFITQRAISQAKYLIRKGVDPKEAIEIAINKYINNPKINIGLLIKEVKKTIKSDLYYEEEQI